MPVKYFVIPLMTTLLAHPKEFVPIGRGVVDAPTAVTDK
jgi:hypothetical protein